VAATEPPRIESELVHTGKRYDVYCAELNHGVVVYRNALFRGTKRLFPRYESDMFAEYVEIEQEKGGTIFVSRGSIIKFCESGVTPKTDDLTGEKQ